MQVAYIEKWLIQNEIRCDRLRARISPAACARNQEMAKANPDIIRAGLLDLACRDCERWGTMGEYLEKLPAREYPETLPAPDRPKPEPAIDMEPSKPVVVRPASKPRSRAVRKGGNGPQHIVFPHEARPVLRAVKKQAKARGVGFEDEIVSILAVAMEDGL